ncbi:MAG: transglutaminaseTgpA domain-containing protein [Planctomycetota bacterium]
MNFYRAFRISTSIMVLVGILSLALAEGNYFYVALALAGGLIPIITNKEIALSPLTNWVMIACCLAFSIWDFSFITGDFVISLAHFLILFQVFNLMSKKTNREYIWMYLISLLNLSVAGIVTTEFSFAFPFVLYMISGTWSLTLFHMKREMEKAEKDGAVKIEDKEKLLGKGLLGSYFFAGTAVMSIITLIMTAFFFVIIPRLSVRYLLRSSFRQRPVTGFTEEVDLGFSGNIDLGYEEVMRVKFLQPAGNIDELTYFRGVALSHYTGEKWLKLSPEVYGLDPDSEKETKLYNKSIDKPVKVDYYVFEGRRVFPVGTLLRGRPRQRWSEDELLIARYWLSPLATDTLFMHQPVDTVEFFSKESPSYLTVDALGSVHSPNPSFGYVAYDAISKMPVTDERILNSAVIYPIINGINYTKLPTTSRYFQTSELRGVAAKFIHQYNAKTPYQIVKAIEKGLSETYSYTRSIKRTPETEPVYDFLFNTKKGHCELFASSMVVLLRTIGVPARVVSGYKGGSWNEYGKFYLVRQKNAHCWVEVYFDNDNNPANGSTIGWVTFEPTPPSPLDDDGLLAPISKFIAYMRLKWINHVVSYSFEDQMQMAHSMRRQTRSVSEWFSDTYKKIRNYFSDPTGSARNRAYKIFIPVIIITLMFLFSFRLIFNKKRSVSQKIRAPSPSLKFYQEFVKLAKKAKVMRKVSQTPLEFADIFCSAVSGKRSGAAKKLRESALFITTRFCHARYGEVILNDEENKKLSEHIQQIKNMLRKKNVI